MPITSFNKARFVTIDTTDTLATAIAPSYFDGIKDYLNVGELIILTASDEIANLRVTAVDPAVTVENSESILPDDSVGFDQLKVDAVHGNRIQDEGITEQKLDTDSQNKLNRILASEVLGLNAPNVTLPVANRALISLPGLGITSSASLTVSMKYKGATPIDPVAVETLTDAIQIEFSGNVVTDEIINYQVIAEVV